MNNLDYVVNKVLEVIRRDIRKSTSDSSDIGTVKRIEGNIAWVQYDENNPQLTPVVISGASCKEGDKVRIKNNNGTAFILGNDSAPPTDDTKAEHAQGIAETAEKTAEDAQITASEAEETAEHTAQYFWYRNGTDSEAGAHVTEVPQDEFESTPAGGNLIMRTNGIAVRDGTKELATFGANKAQIGVMGEQRATMGAGGFTLVSSQDIPLFSVEPSNNPTSAEFPIEKDFDDGVSLGVDEYTLEYAPVSGSTILVQAQAYNVSGLDAYFTAGTSATINHITYNATTKKITMASGYGNYKIWLVRYRAVSGDPVDLGILTYGTRRAGTYGNGSATFGRELRAGNTSQFVIGRYNLYNSNDLFEIGNGTSDNASNAFAVGSGGEIYNNDERIYFEKNLVLYQQTNGEWTVCKHTNGIIEAWYNGSFESSFTSSNFGAYRGSSQTISIPNVGQEEILFMTADGVLPNTGFISLGVRSTTSVTIWPYNRTQSSTALEVPLYIHVVMY